MFVGCRLNIDLNGAGISRKLPRLERFDRLDGMAIHRDSVGQETQNRKARQKARNRICKREGRETD